MALFWTASVAWFFYLPSEGIPAGDGARSVEPLTESVGRTEFGAFATAYFNPQHDYRPEYTIGFERLRLSNRPLGLLRTALHRSVHIDQLAVSLYAWPDTSGDATGRGDQGIDGIDSTGLPAYLNDLRAYFPEPLAPMRDATVGRYIRLPDISKATQINVDGFSLHWYRQDDIALTIESRRAVYAIEKAGQIALLGRVVITTPTCVLQANRVNWNIEQQVFEVQGRYYVSTPDGQQSGQSVTLDYRLNTAARQTVSANTYYGGSL